MGLCDEVRHHCATVAAGARWVSIDLDALATIEPGPEPELDRERHYLEGPRADVATYMLTLDAINFGSGWFPTLRKRPNSSGYFTVAWALADRFRLEGPWSNPELRSLDAATVAKVLGQDPGHELMGLYAQALRDLGDFLGDRTALDLIAEANGSAERLATSLARGMPFFDDKGFYKRAQIVPERPRPGRDSRLRRPRRRSRSSPTTSCRTCCAWTACCATSRRWRTGSTARSCCGRARRRRRSAPAPYTPAS